MNNELHSNEDLFLYLQSVAKELRENDHNNLAEEVDFAIRFASGSSSEFLNEAQLVLVKILKTTPEPLSPIQLNEIKSVISKIEKAFREIGGA